MSHERQAEERPLKLVQGGASATKTRTRTTARRKTPVKRATVRKDPITELLEHLDEEKDLSPSGTTRTIPYLLIAAAVAILLAAFAGWQWYGDHELDVAHQRALAAAKQVTVNFVSVSASTVDRDLQRIADGATGDFGDEFGRGRGEVRSAVVENKVESKGTVLRAALVSGTKHSAVVLVAVDATVKNVKAPDGRTSHYRIQVDVGRDADSGSWRVAKLQFVG